MSRGGVRYPEGRTAALDGVQEALAAGRPGPGPKRWGRQPAVRATSTVLANISHEIRTPLTALLGSAQLLLRDQGLSAPQRAQLEIIHRSGTHLCEVLSKVLEMSRIQAGRASLRPVPFDLGLLLADVAAMGRAGAEARGVGFEVVLGGAVPRYAISDACKLHQVLANVLGNAVKFTRHGYVALRIDATLEGPGSYTLQVEVEDTGEGIAEGEMAGLFEPFGQSASGRDHAEGTGLGLALSRDYVRLLGGELTLTSQVGRGTTFRFSIPVQAAQQVDVDLAGARTRASRLRLGHEERRVLVVHADAQTRVLLSDTLRRAGFRTREAATGDEGAAWFEEWEPHLVFVEAGMSHLTALEALRRGRAGPGGKAVPVLGVLALPTGSRAAVAGGMACDGLVHLPLCDNEIFDRLAEALGVEYETVGASGTAAAGDGPASPGLVLARGDLTCLDAGLVDRMREATALLDFERLVGLVEEAEAQSASVGASLREMVSRYAYDALTDLLRREEGRA